MYNNVEKTAFKQFFHDVRRYGNATKWNVPIFCSQSYQLRKLCDYTFEN